MKETLEAILIGADATVRQAMEAIDRGAVQIALVADENRWRHSQRPTRRSFHGHLCARADAQ